MSDTTSPALTPDDPAVATEGREGAPRNGESPAETHAAQPPRQEIVDVCMESGKEF